MPGTPRGVSSSKRTVTIPQIVTIAQKAPALRGGKPADDAIATSAITRSPALQSSCIVLFAGPVGLALLRKREGSFDRVFRLEQASLSLVMLPDRVLDRNAEAGQRGLLGGLHRQRRAFHNFAGPSLGG